MIFCCGDCVDVGKVYIGLSPNDTHRLYAFSSNIPRSLWAVPVYLHGGTAGVVCMPGVLDTGDKFLLYMSMNHDEFFFFKCSVSVFKPQPVRCGMCTIHTRLW